MMNAQTLRHGASGACGNNGKKWSKRPIPFHGEGLGREDEKDEIRAEVIEEIGKVWGGMEVMEEGPPGS
jgi:hypothetical protein